MEMEKRFTWEQRLYISTIPLENLNRAFRMLHFQQCDAVIQVYIQQIRDTCQRLLRFELMYNPVVLWKLRGILDVTSAYAAMSWNNDPSLYHRSLWNYESFVVTRNLKHCIYSEYNYKCFWLRTLIDREQ